MRRFYLPDTPNFRQLVNGALAALLDETQFEIVGGLTIEETTAYFRDMWLTIEDGLYMVGSIVPYMSALPPDGCIACDGSTHLRSDYPQLYAVLDAAFIIDADTFITPDLRGRTVIGGGSGTGLTPRIVGQVLGEESHVLSVAELASHSHEYVEPINNVDLEDVGAPELGASRPVFTSQTGSTGGDAPHNNMQPSFVLNYCVVSR